MANRSFAISAGALAGGIAALVLGTALALAVRTVTALSPTSTMAGRPAASRWVNSGLPLFFPATSASDEEHFDFSAVGRGVADFTVAVGAMAPERVHLRFQSAGIAQMGFQVEAGAGGGAPGGDPAATPARGARGVRRS